MKTLDILGRSSELFTMDILNEENTLLDIVKGSKFLVVGGAGSIGTALTKELFKRGPKVLHVVDISENNLAELVRQIRSSLGYNDGEFETFVLDCGSYEFDSFVSKGVKYDYIFNLSALKHVRSEKDPYTLMRLIETNIINAIKLMNISLDHGAKNYFCVSTDKASNPVNMMGASKRIMELFLNEASNRQKTTMSRFANVAFSDGSLLHGFRQRLINRQPISAPLNIKRYFISPEEAGELCILSGLLGENRDIFFPKLQGELQLEEFANIAIRFVEKMGYRAFLCEEEAVARSQCDKLINSGNWPIYLFKSDTTGEKDFEEFYTEDEEVNLQKYIDIGIVKGRTYVDNRKLDNFLNELDHLKHKQKWTRAELVNLFKNTLPNFDHIEKGKFLDSRM